MARIRTIKPEFWSSPTLARVSREARLTFVGLWNQADDSGRCEAIPRALLGALFPFDQDVTEGDVVGCIDELAAVGVVQLYENRRRRYLFCTGWGEHQRVDKPSNPRCPGPNDESSTPLDSLAGDSRQAREGHAKDSRDPIDRNVGTSERGSVGAWEGEGDADASPPAPQPEASRDEAGEQFEAFWSAYPRNAKSGKPGGGAPRAEAEKRWRKLAAADREAALVGVKHYADYCSRPDAEFAAHATTWLNQRRWEDWQEPAALPASNGPAPKGQTGHDAWTAKAAQLRQQEAAR